MLRRVAMLCLAVLLLIFFAGCTRTSVDKGNKIAVYTTYYPIYDFAAKIGGDKVQVASVVPAGVEPHEWEPTARDIINISNANIFVYLGGEMEPWAGRMLDSIDKSKVLVVDASNGILLRKVDGAVDGHVWLNPQYSKILAQNILTALKKADPSNSQFYEGNYNNLLQRLDQIDSKYQQDLSKVKSRDVVVSHSAYGYLADRYSLNQIAIAGLDPEQEPGSAKIGEIVSEVKRKNIKYIFSEQLVNERLEKVIADETGAKIKVLSPVENLTESQKKQGKDYFSEMESNLETLKKALGYYNE